MKTKKDAPLWDARFLHMQVVDEWVLDGDYTQFSLSSEAHQPGRFSEQIKKHPRKDVCFHLFIILFNFHFVHYISEFFGILFTCKNTLFFNKFTKVKTVAICMSCLLNLPTSKFLNSS